LIILTVKFGEKVIKLPLGKHFLIITDTFLPDNNEAAVQFITFHIKGLKA